MYCVYMCVGIYLSGLSGVITSTNFSERFDNFI